MSDPKTVKFLLVDDLDANLIALESLLQRPGVELLKATSGPAALELLLLHEVALALVDVQMPEMSGFELAEIMRSTERTRRIPIIFLTAGMVDHDRRIRGYETGAIDFLPKPLDPGMLLNKAAVFYELALQRQELQHSEARLKEANEKLAWSNAELARADRSKDEFLATLVHELRAPLAPMLAGMEVLCGTQTDPATVGSVAEMMRRQLGQMARLIEDLSDVSRIANRKIALEQQRLPVSRILSQAVEAIRPLMDRFGHELIVAEAPGELWIEADHGRLTQVVSNLLTNAAKYTPAGGRIVLATAADPAGRVVRISVKDNGKGIHPEHRHRIFDLFDQGAAGPKDGLGIGLTLVKSLVELHGGTIAVLSEGPGQGSEFIVTLPAAEAVAPPAANGMPLESGTAEATALPEPPAVAGTAPAQQLRVLVADDGRSTADILGMFFRMEGMDARVVYDGKQAIEEAMRFRPHLACLDLTMPRVDGFEAARQVRQSLPETYLVALSGWGGDEDRRRSGEAGFDEHLTKPVSPEELRRVLRLALAAAG